MKARRERTPYYARRPYRLLSGIFGTFLIGAGVYVLLFAGPLTTLHLVVGPGLVLLGGNLSASAFAAKESWLSRIGPLP